MQPSQSSGRAPCRGRLHPREHLRSMLPAHGAHGRDGSGWVSPATKPKPCLQGSFSTQVWQLASEQCMPARHWHTVLCVAFPCLFTMRPASVKGSGDTVRVSQGGVQPLRPHTLGTWSTYCPHRFHGACSAFPLSSSAGTDRSHRVCRQSLLCRCIQRPASSLQRGAGEGGIKEPSPTGSRSASRTREH